MNDTLHIGSNNLNNIFYYPEKNLNGHVLITGKSGSGKSNAIKNISKQLVQTNAKLFIFNFSNSFEQNLKNFTYIDILLHPCIREPFSIHANVNNAYDSLIQYVDIISSIWKLGTSQRACIIRALVAMQNIYINNLTILNCNNSFYPYIDTSFVLPKPDFALLAYLLEEMNTTISTRLTDKFLDIILQVSNDIDFYQKLIPLNNKSHIIYQFPSSNCEINKKLTELFLWSAWINRSNNYDNSMPPFYIIIDECQQLNFTSDSIMKKLLTEGRKFGFNLILATQSLFHAFSKEVQTNLLQCGLRLIFSPPEAELVSSAKSIEQSNWQEWTFILRNLSKGECIAVGILSGHTYYSFQKIKVKTPWPI